MLIPPPDSAWLLSLSDSPTVLPSPPLQTWPSSLRSGADLSSVSRDSSGGRAQAVPGALSLSARLLPPALPEGALAPAARGHAGPCPEPGGPHATALPPRLLCPAPFPLPTPQDHPAAEPGTWIPGQVQAQSGQGSLGFCGQAPGRLSLNLGSEFPIPKGMQAESRGLCGKGDKILYVFPSHPLVLVTGG